MAIIRIQDGPGEQATLSTTMSRQSFHGRRSGSRILSTGGGMYRKVGNGDRKSKRISGDVRVSLQGVPMAPKTTETSEKLW